MAIEANLDISPEQRKTLISLLNRYIPNTTVWAFGSRAKWQARVNSDLDLVAFSKPNQSRSISALKEALEESNLPFKVDFLVWDNIPKSFQENIESHYVELAATKPLELTESIEVPLNDFITLQRGFDLPSQDRKNGNVPIVASTGVVGTHDEIRVKAPGVVIGRSGSIGGGQYVTTDFWPLNTTLWVKDFKGHNPRYIYYLLKSIDFKQFNVGSGVPTLNRNHLSSILVKDIGLEQEEKLASIVGALDDKIELNNQINQTLEAMAQAIFKSWFVDFEPVKAKMAVLQAGGSKAEAELATMMVISGKTAEQLSTMRTTQLEAYQQLTQTAALFPSAMQESELGEIPVGWIAGAFKDCCSRVESGGTPSRKQPAFWGGEIPWLSSGEVRDVVILDTKEKITLAGLTTSNAKLWPAMTTVVAMYGATAGQVGLIAQEMTANQACCALIPNKEYKAFIFIAARESIQELAGKASGSAQQNLNKSLIENHQHIIPNREIAEKFEVVTCRILEQWILNQRTAVSLAQTRDSLLPKLLSGEIDLSHLEETAA